MSQFFCKGGIALNDTEWIQDFADRRLQYGVSQTKLAVMAGISREHLSRIESGKVAVTEEMKVKLLEALEKFNPEAPLTMLFDYVRIRFPTLDIGHIIKDCDIGTSVISEFYTPLVPKGYDFLGTIGELAHIRQDGQVACGAKATGTD